LLGLKVALLMNKGLNVKWKMSGESSACSSLGSNSCDQHEDADWQPPSRRLPEGQGVTIFV